MNLRTRLLTIFSLFWVFLANSSYAETGTTSLEEKRLSRLESTVMNANLPLEKRIRALRKIIREDIVDGVTKRTLCVWDPLGRSGPIASAVGDQKLRALHYGLDLDFIVFQSESAIIDAYKGSDQCDSILVRGEAAREFNRFTGTLDALGGVQNIDQFQLLSQVMANPRMANKMVENGHIVLGVAYAGTSQAFNNDSSKDSIYDFQRQRVAVDVKNKATSELVKKLGSTPVENDFLTNSAAYSRGEVGSMFAPLMSYLAIEGNRNSTRILRTTLSLSTIQLIGKADKFHIGMGQLLREDFLFKFFNYVERVGNEIESTIPESTWVQPDDSRNQQMEKLFLEVRLKLRSEGYYDAAMLTLQRKVRCKFSPSRDECRAPKE